MPRFLRSIAGRLEKNTAPVNRYEGFKGDRAVVFRDRRGTAMAEIPSATEKSAPMGEDPLAIYKSVDAAKAMVNLTGWTYAAINAIADDVTPVFHPVETRVRDRTKPPNWTATQRGE